MGKPTKEAFNAAKLDWGADLQAVIDMAIAEKKPGTVSVIPYAVNFVAYAKKSEP